MKKYTVELNSSEVKAVVELIDAAVHSTARRNNPRNVHDVLMMTAGVTVMSKLHGAVESISNNVAGMPIREFVDRIMEDVADMEETIKATGDPMGMEALRMAQEFLRNVADKELGAMSN